MAYDSDEGPRRVRRAHRAVHGAANLTSAELAEAVGPFAEYEKNREPCLRVMQMHRDAVDKIDSACPA